MLAWGRPTINRPRNSQKFCQAGTVTPESHRSKFCIRVHAELTVVSVCCVGREGVKGGHSTHSCSCRGLSGGADRGLWRFNKGGSPQAPHYQGAPWLHVSPSTRRCHSMHMSGRLPEHLQEWQQPFIEDASWPDSEAVTPLMAL